MKTDSSAPIATGAREKRVERWARGLCEADGVDPDKILFAGEGLCWTAYRVRACAIMALADAEVAALSPAYVDPQWVEYRKITGDLIIAANAVAFAQNSEESLERYGRIDIARNALDAFVLRLISVSGASG